jgi:hypothetical protein
MDREHLIFGQCRTVAGLVLAGLCVAAPAQAIEAATCRELERKLFDLIKPDMVSVKLNAALFAAADAGCEEFARRLLTARAAPEARDRLGAMPLAHAARAGQRALVERKRCELPRRRAAYDRVLNRVGIQYWRISSTTAGISL